MADSEQQTELARDIGFLGAFTLGVGTMIGAGIFILPSIAAGGAGPASAISFAIGGIVSLLTAISLSELATGMPRAGGSYYYVNNAMGPLMGSIVGWGMWMGLMFATAFCMVGFGQYLTFFVPAEIEPAWFVTVAALVMAALLVIINYRGVKEASGAQNLIVVVLLGLLIAFAGIGLFNVDTEMLTPFNPEGWSAAGALAATLYIAFVGLEVIATRAEELKEPGRNLPVSMIAAVVTSLVLAVLVMLVSTGASPGGLLDGSRSPVADVAEQFAGSPGAVVMVVAAVVATGFSAYALIVSAGRINFAMGRDGLLLDWFNEIHGRFYTPYRAVVVAGIVALGLIGMGVDVEKLAQLAAFSFLVAHALVHLAVVLMRRNGPDEYDPDFEIPGLLYPTVPVLGFVACLGLISQMSPIIMGIGTGIVALGVVWFLFYARYRADDSPLIGEPLLGEQFEDLDEDDAFRVVVPVANPATEQTLVKMAAAGAHEHPDAELVAVNVLTVPPQTTPAQQLEFEETRIARQQKLLEAARNTASALDIALRTRAVVARDPVEAILSVARAEDANRLVVGWKGRRRRRDYLTGSTIDRVIDKAPCEVNLVKAGPDRVGDVLALIGTGPSAKMAAAEALEISHGEEDTSLTLLNVQKADPDETSDPEELGMALIREVAAEAGLEHNDYEPKVVVGEDVEETLLEQAVGYDTICVGATRMGVVEQVLFDSLPKRISEEAPGTVVIVDPKARPRTITEAIAKRFRRTS